ncbi:hypothetical protein F4861DRAFT_545700 [Xylaria intraflava]|nr:hypothetical protein F4861DRAFT_545700 [Xylaria intraflava]
MADYAGQSAPYRRKIRKGTTSCWECKRRKQRCHFATHQSRVCVPCQRRGKACLTQEFNDPIDSQETYRHTSTGTEVPLQSLEVLLETPPGHDTLDPVHGEGSSQSLGNGRAIQGLSIEFFDSTLVDLNAPPNNLDASARPGSHSRGDGDALSRVLHAVLPSQHDANLIIGSSYTPAFLQFFTLPYQRLFSGCMQSATSPVVPCAWDSEYSPPTFDTRLLDLGGSPNRAMFRYLNTASRLVTSNDALIESIEGLECLILEAIFHIHTGSLRRGWFVLKRAVSLAQLMGLHTGRSSGFTVLDPKSQSIPAMMWYRIVGQDRYLSLVLGLPPSMADDLCFASQTQMPSDSATGKLERKHYDIMGKMASRSAQPNNPLDDDFIRNIDDALQLAAHSLPSVWWLIPRASYGMQVGAVDTTRNIEDLGRILVQINHYNLLVTLYLPSVISPRGTHADDHGLTTCLNSCRELLSRYIRLRCIRVAPFCCRMMDLSAFTACLAILTAHIARYQHTPYSVNPLAHQHLSDRATVDETIRLLLETSDSDKETLLMQQAAEILKCLRIIEADITVKFNDNSPDMETTGDDLYPKRSIRLKVPFLGTIIISANGIMSPSEHPTEDGTPDPNAECWSPMLNLPLSPSVYPLQEHGDPDELNPSSADNAELTSQRVLWMTEHQNDDYDSRMRSTMSGLYPGENLSANFAWIGAA